MGEGSVLVFSIVAIAVAVAVAVAVAAAVAAAVAVVGLSAKPLSSSRVFQ